ncbi:MAG: PEP-CTERM sorting domain-containing protein [Phycisphaerae bacterium]|nr:PEP-CTERM sorting domain-containing protein [Phycisphaerae bacterium]
MSNWDFQAVNAMGVSTWTGTYPITITGVILNNPEDMLDSTYDDAAYAEGRMGAQWQIFIQGIGEGENEDHNGTALWMGQNYSSLPWGYGTYDGNAWAAEMLRLNYYYDINNDLQQFRQGDLVTVTANISKFYGGKRNINEDHDTDPQYDFTVTLVEAQCGLPTAKELTLADLYADPLAAGYDSNYPKFDPSRKTGAEYYQGMYVHVTGLTLTENGDGGWGQTAWDERLCEVTDGQGRLFNLRMPLYDLGDAPDGEFEVYGIINQESGKGNDGRFGYEIFIMDVVPEPATVSILLVGIIGSCLSKRRRT